MAILIDYSQTSISALMGQLNSNPNEEFDLELVRHVILNNLLFYRQKFSNEYGELVIACDGKNYWRKDIFPYYKAKRSENRQKSGFDWDKIYLYRDTVQKELIENFPYKVIQIDKIEADDIIATLCKYYDSKVSSTSSVEYVDNGSLDFLSGDATISSKEKVLIISEDTDFLQLQKYKNVSQYAPNKKMLIRSSNPKVDLIEKIIRGDSGDGIPNILSADDVIVTPGVKQKSMMTKNVELWKLEEDYNSFCTTDEMKKNFIRNTNLIDLSKIPQEIEDKILEEFNRISVNPRKMLYPYFIKNKLKHLTQYITDF